MVSIFLLRQGDKRRGVSNCCFVGSVRDTFVIHFNVESVVGPDVFQIPISGVQGRDVVAIPVLHLSSVAHRHGDQLVPNHKLRFEAEGCCTFRERIRVYAINKSVFFDDHFPSPPVFFVTVVIHGVAGVDVLTFNLK